MALIMREVARQALEGLVRRDAAAGPRSLAEADVARDRNADEIAPPRTALRLRDGKPAREATPARRSPLRAGRAFEPVTLSSGTLHSPGSELGDAGALAASSFGCLRCARAVALTSGLPMYRPTRSLEPAFGGMSRRPAAHARA
jgi:hypothetical protein